MQHQFLYKMTASSRVGFGTSGVRGLVADMSDELCYAYTSAFLQTVATKEKQIVIGHDLRPSSPDITAACATAIKDAGRDYIYAGALPTPALAYYASQIAAPALIVTGSHIPFDRNGIKFYSASGEISKAQEQEMLAASIAIPADLTKANLPLIDNSAREAYTNRYVQFFGTGILDGMRIALYEHSSVARDVLREILETLGAEVLSVGRSDSFVPIDTEAVRPEDINQALKWAQAYAFDAIVTTDGDADRPLIGDENGQWLRGDIVGILCARYLQAKHVVAPVSCNTALEQSHLFQSITRTRIGSPYVIAGMEALLKQHSGLVAGFEANGGFLLGGDVVSEGKTLRALPTRDATLPILALLCDAKTRKCKLSELAQRLPARFTASDRLQQFPTELSQKLLAELQSDKNSAAITLAPNSGNIIDTDLTDGLRQTFANGDIVHLRPSGNAPELRCYAEADSAQHAQELCNAVLQRLSLLKQK
jgi:phosphomannomutase